MRSISDADSPFTEEAILADFIAWAQPQSLHLNLQVDFDPTCDYESHTPLEEVWGAVGRAIQEGKVRSGGGRGLIWVKAASRGRVLPCAREGGGVGRDAESW